MPHPTVNKVDIQKNDKAIDLHLEARSMGWARTSGNRLFIPISLYPTKVFKNDKPHTIDMLNAGFVDEETMTFHLPEGFTIEALPSSQVVESVFGRYELDIKQLDKDIQVTMHMHYNSGVYPAEQYAEWIAFRQNVMSFRLVLQKSRVISRYSSKRIDLILVLILPNRVAGADETAIS